MRSGYCDEIESNWQWIKWRGQVASAIRGKRGQALLKEFGEALDAMPEKALYGGSFQRPEGGFCTLGVLAATKGIKTDDLGDADSGVEIDLAAIRFNVAEPLICEIMHENDERIGVSVTDPDAPKKRWKHMREWVREKQAEATR